MPRVISALDTSPPSTAVILVNYNTAEYSVRCVESILKGVTAPLIVVVDNGSEGHDFDLLRSISQHVVIIRSSKNVGFGRGNNLAIHWVLTNTSCRFVFVLNNDTCVECDTVQILQSYFENHGTVGACTPRIMLSSDRSTYWYGGGTLNWWMGGARSTRFLKTFDGDDEVRDVTFMTGCAMFLRRELLEQLGGFDPRFFMYCEDWEFSGRIGKSDWDMRYLPDAVIYHEGHASIRGGAKKYLSPLDHDNPSRNFYLTHVVSGSLLALELSAPILAGIVGRMYLMLRWVRWAVNSLIHGRWDSVIAIGRGFVAYLEMRKKTASGPRVESQDIVVFGLNALSNNSSGT